ncbi:MAG: M15 family metallopeptidase, partial [Acidimicrobiales bacterium]
SLATVSCPTGGSITVASPIAGSVQSLLNAAASDGVPLCGGGYRSSQGQIETRKNNCGTSYYAIYEMPASQCSPPTARPGQSMHEQGRAIDFTYQGRVIGSRSGPAWNWMSANANSYGLYNLPSEPWHWSTTGG